MTDDAAGLGLWQMTFGDGAPGAHRLHRGMTHDLQSRRDEARDAKRPTPAIRRAGHRAVCLRRGLFECLPAAVTRPDPWLTFRIRSRMVTWPLAAGRWSRHVPSRGSASNRRPADRPPYSAVVEVLLNSQGVHPHRPAPCRKGSPGPLRQELEPCRIATVRRSRLGPRSMRRRVGEEIPVTLPLGVLCIASWAASRSGRAASSGWTSSLRTLGPVSPITVCRAPTPQPAKTSVLSTA